MAYANLALGRHSAAADLVAALAKKGYSSAMWYMGIALVRDGAIQEGIEQLEAARKAFYRDQRAEGRASVLVGLGDAYQISGRREDALAEYDKALRQPPHMDNAVSIKAAKLRLSADGFIIRSRSDIHLA
jgi:tetratricopeptide (TPR) repeat protein